MARDHFSETTSVSWFGRLRNSVGGVLIGLLLIVASAVGLFWNEGRAVTTARSLAEGKGLVVSVDAGTVDPMNEGALVHVSGPLSLAGPLADPAFGVSADAIRLVRKVEMYQWRETKRSETRQKLGGGEETVTTYDYDRTWAADRIDSANFRETAGHENPPLPFSSETTTAESAKLGAFTVEADVLSGVGSERALSVPADRAGAIAASLGLGRSVSVVAGVVRVGDDPDRPRVGDLRVSFAMVPPLTISAVGRQAAGTLVPYQTESGDALLMAEDGTVPADAMFAHAESANTVLTWVIRVVGLLVMWIAFSMVLAPLSVFASVIPFLGSIVGFGTGLVAALLTAILGPVVIAVAWFWYRPLVSLAILAVAALAVGFFVWRGRRKAAMAAAPA